MIINETDSEEKIRVSFGQDLSIRLASNPSTGYRWSVAHSDLGEPLNSRFHQRGPSDAIGSGGYEEFLWRPQQSGRIRMKYAREWEKNIDPIRFFEVEIEVEGE